MPMPALSPEYAYAIGVTGLMGLANFYGASTVMKARKTHNVKYPKLYADGDSKSAIAFNCAQRAHQNTLESLPLTAVSMLACATVYPVASAALGAVWSLGRIVYIRGYAANGPEGRMLGGLISHLGDLPLLLMSLYVGGQAIMASRR